MSPAAILFDAFGTLFDLSALRERAEAVIGARGGEVFDRFSPRLVPLTWHLTAGGHYMPFPEVAQLALRSAAREAGVELGDAEAGEIAQGLTSLPAFPDAAGALEALEGTPLAVISNGTQDGIEALVDGAGLREHFAAFLPADRVGAFKPSPRVYGMAQERFEAAAEQLVLVSGNEWDIAGSKLAGLRAVWIARGRPTTGFLGIEPDAVADELADLPAAVEGLDV